VEGGGGGVGVAGNTGPKLIGNGLVEGTQKGAAFGPVRRLDHGGGFASTGAGDDVKRSRAPLDVGENRVLLV